MPDLTEPEIASARRTLRGALQEWKEWHARLQGLIAGAESYSTEALLVSLDEVRFGMCEAETRVARTMAEFKRLLTGDTNSRD
jgi:hypothetical protein